jgi:hypothetical protein
MLIWIIPEWPHCLLRFDEFAPTAQYTEFTGNGSPSDNVVCHGHVTYTGSGVAQLTVPRLRNGSLADQGLRDLCRRKCAVYGSGKRGANSA